MPELSNFEVRQARLAERRRKRLVIAGSVAGTIAVVVGLGALIYATFPRSGLPATPSGSATTSGSTTSSATAAALKAKATKKPAAPVAAPLGMNNVLAGSRELIVATGPAIGAKDGRLRIFELGKGSWKQVITVACRFGTKGLIDGTQRVRNDNATPTGIWWPGTFAWGWRVTGPSGTKLPYRQTNKNTWWSDESGSTFNTWVESTQKLTGEHLLDAKVQYEYGYSTGYNAKPNQVVESRGSAIFLHVFDPPNYNGGYSAGCVAVSRTDMIRVLKIIDPARKPCFAVGIDATGTPVSIASY